ncbi:Crp/Fnr family transcriptional regulator [Acidisarcina polymorpha]|nr:Crp/Fnr family transcriptional regulator [Acidisarcina polymorpha]
MPAFTPVLAGRLNIFQLLPAVRLLKAGTLLLEQGCAASSVYLVRQGTVKLEHLTTSGREITLGLRSEGWYAGSTSVLMGIRTIYSVRALTDCVVARIHASQFSRLLQASSEMMSHLLEVLCLELASQISLQIEMTGCCAEQRLDHFMTERERVHPFGVTMDPLPILKQMELAQLLSITPEHLSRLMQKRKQSRCRRVA